MLKNAPVEESVPNALKVNVFGGYFWSEIAKITFSVFGAKMRNSVKGGKMEHFGAKGSKA